MDRHRMAVDADRRREGYWGSAVKRGPLWWWTGVAMIPLVLAAGVIALFIVAAAFSSDGEEPTPTPTAGPMESPAPGPATEKGAPLENETAVEQPKSAATGRFEIAALGVDAALDAMTVFEGIVDPPNFSDAFQITGPAYGNVREPGSGTVYVAVHSARGFDAVGNPLIDRGSGTSRVEAGTEIIVDGVPFTVTGTVTVAKDELRYLDGAWDGSHGLVVITCQQFGDGRPSQNSVIFATRP